MHYVYGAGGQLLRSGTSEAPSSVEYLYLDEIPVAQLDLTGINYLETDHLGTPRVAASAASNAQTWRWDFLTTAFGEHPPVEGSTSVSLRYPGQVFDSESGLHYNYFRNYDPTVGRYVESDPIGLRDGVSTYSYVRGRPSTLVDTLGLFSIQQKCPECSDTWHANLDKDIANSCVVGTARIKEDSLRKCVELRCKTGKVKVHCKAPYPGYYDCPDPKKDPDKPYEHDVINISAYDLATDKPTTGLGESAIHEWAHSCNWGHVDTGLGVPARKKSVDPEASQDQRCRPSLPMGEFL
ncbi:RHS repeat-associated core domain-containing protein [Tahibacter amnicola]|uniref:RHS repeat-associated core domain-containing protein n=1 Tax=Tahibacter amnicola TaxID=2976241 RepID=A0ABY6BEP6_9GAMM|nr:RHS repeat-associated core domain-containing protein [Tahibacter amnicola]UXI68214.1 RHS repeat-associated core domain-containing protein [Tahibacter amnicola]